ncbi:MAG TPA: glycoside hydrolase family 15 protein [Chloroflexota bacterium]|nr:glycoside hydrolase family 15 protein [Chloroflexota bacterium]
MDIYSAARRFNRPHCFEPETRAEDLPPGAHGLIGDGTTCALVRLDGAIDWLCLPRFDSPSVFAQILDERRGGVTALTPARRPYKSYQRYDPDTNVLDTLFEVADQGSIRLTDYMPWTNDPRAAIHEVHRRLECRDGDVDINVVFDPRFGYSEHAPRFEVSAEGALAIGPNGERLAAALSRPCSWQERPEGGLCAQLHLHSGERVWMVISWDTARVSPISAHRPFEHLRSTRRHWREWAAQLRYDGPWRHYVMRSALTLKLLQYAPSGGMVAAPTTSLPEGIGGVRNWDYRYVWMRDAALCIRAMNLIGYSQESLDFFHFVGNALTRHESLHIFYSVEGGMVPDEQTLPWLSGFRGSAPVRIGNGAKEQLQLDNAGYLLDAAFVYERFGNALSLRFWRHLVKLMDRMQNEWHKPDHGIWEPRGGMHHNVHTKTMLWVAFDRAARIAQLFGEEDLALGWRLQADRIRSEVLSRGLDPTARHFVSHYEGTEPDATLLLLPAYGLLPATDPRVLSTISFVQQRLGDRGFVYRYHYDDGLSGPEGAFILCGFWLVEALAMAGRLDEAMQVFERHAEASNHVGLLGEQIDPESGTLLGNFPQGFSHMGLIHAAARIDLGLRLRDEKSQKHPILDLEA